MASIVHITVKDRPRKLRIGSDDEAQIRALVESSSPGATITKIEPEGVISPVAMRTADAKATYDAQELAKKRDNEAAVGKAKADLNV